MDAKAEAMAALAAVPKGAGEAVIQFRVDPRRYEVTMPDGSKVTVRGGSDAALKRAMDEVSAWVDRWTEEQGGAGIYVLTTTTYHYDPLPGEGK